MESLKVYKARTLSDGAGGKEEPPQTNLADNPFDNESLSYVSGYADKLSHKTAMKKTRKADWRCDLCNKSFGHRKGRLEAHKLKEHP